MIRVSYFDPRSEQSVERDVDTVDQVFQLIDIASNLSSARGHPTIEITQSDGATLGFSSDGRRAFLVWVDSIGDSYHSVGGTYHDLMIFDYFGSWSEAPSDYLVIESDGREFVKSFIETGLPVTRTVLFSPD